jgi:hypothetical protein
MKKRTFLFLMALAVAVALCWAAPAADQVTLEVLNPRGEVPALPALALRPRVSDLSGKKIALIDNGKPGARNLLDAVQEILKQRYPTATIIATRKKGGLLSDAKEWYPEAVKEFDTFVFGVGD